eukprot:6812868-Pyramimonas_sp.AAC.1
MAKNRVTNRSCGLALLYGERLNGTVSNIQVPPTSPGLSGRLGLVKFHLGRMSLAVFVIYLPPKGPAAKLLHNTVKTAFGWIQNEMDRMGNHCLPMIMGDLNCAFGVRTDVTGRSY